MQSEDFFLMLGALQYFMQDPHCSVQVTLLELNDVKQRRLKSSTRFSFASIAGSLASPWTKASVKITIIRVNFMSG